MNFHIAFTTRDFLIQDFALAHGLSVRDVKQMIDIGLAEVVEAVGGEIVLWAEGLTPEEGKAAWRAIQRCQRDMFRVDNSKLVAIAIVGVK